MKFGLIGHKLSHSYSAIIHKEFGYDYDLIELERESLDDFAQSGGYDGFNVTIPYKTDIIPCLDELDGTARLAGAVNTVIRKDGKLIGYNTDIFGLTYLLESAGIKLSGKKVIILGGGGTSKTAQVVAKLSGARETVVISRSGEDNYGNLYKHYDANIIINTTPVGMYPNNLQTPLDITPFKNLEGVADAIYNPFITDLLFDARERGIKHVSGLKMLIAQAKRARDLFLGNTAPDGEIQRIYDKIYKDTLNIVLVGMPSAGKTAVGKALADMLGKTFVDTDEYIENSEGKSVPDIFKSGGEAYFRKLERAAVLSVGKEKGQVIATGGGALNSEEAYRALKQNGIIVYLTRDKNKAVSDGRPLLTEPGAYERLLSAREPIYKKYSDFTIDNNGELNQTVKKIAEKIYENTGN